MADYEDDLLRRPPDRLTSWPIVSDRVTYNPNAPSSVRVLGKSMYVLAAGWTAAIGWLWVAAIQQHLLRRNVPPPFYAMDTVVSGILPALAMALVGWWIARMAGRAPYAQLERREWWHAFWWSIFPNIMLFVTVWVMIQEAR